MVKATLTFLIYVDFNVFLNNFYLRMANDLTKKKKKKKKKKKNLKKFF